jgi:hypothetical protein
LRFLLRVSADIESSGLTPDLDAAQTDMNNLSTALNDAMASSRPTAPVAGRRQHAARHSW